MNDEEVANTDISDEGTEKADDMPLYKIESSPNDFNLLSYIQFIEKGTFVIPKFQRNYVWDLPRASKLIESLIIGLPIPQVFLFQDEHGKLLIIDGQQRLLSILFFMKGRFPDTTKRTELKQVIIDNKKITDDNFLNNNTYFKDFKLQLEGNIHLHNKAYKDLDEKMRNTFDLRTLRSIFIKQIEPEEQNSSASSTYEIFHRLNAGGMNLNPQEIRNTIFGSEFYDLLEKLNSNETWRKIINKKSPDKQQRDKEIILRCIALSLKLDKYTPSMTKFLNEFSEQAKNMSQEQRDEIEKKFKDFMTKIENMHGNAQSDKKIETFLDESGKLSLTVFDAVFVAYYQNDTIELSVDKINRIKNEIKENFSGKRTTDKAFINSRIAIAKKILYSNE